MILVFGGGGQLGQELVALAREAGMPITALAHGQADIADPAGVDRAIATARPGFIVNAAAYNAVDRAESETDAAMRANAEGPGVLAAAARRTGVPLVHISSDYVFDGEKGSAYVEDDPVNPLSVYGRSKAAGEEAVRHGTVEHFILRTAWVFGPHGSNFLKTMLRLAGERDSLDVVADQTGSPTTTADLARAILILAERGDGHWGTYHLGGTGVASRYEFASAVVEARAAFTGRQTAVKPVATAAFPTAARRPAHAPLDSSRFAETFGFRAADWRDAVNDTVARLFAEKVKS